VGLTRERTGVLLYVSQLEGEARVLADKGITDSIPPETWRATTKRVESLARNARGGDGLARAIREFAEPLAHALPARGDDIDELPDLAEPAE
jgi:putative membrane protein